LQCVAAPDVLSPIAVELVVYMTLYV